MIEESILRFTYIVPPSVVVEYIRQICIITSFHYHEYRFDRSDTCEVSSPIESQSPLINMIIRVCRQRLSPTVAARKLEMTTTDT